MSIAITQTIHVLQIIVQTVPVGTNLALLQLMWTMLNGSFLQSRGAIFPALKANGFSAEESRRIWRAFRQGIWRINECIARWHNYVLSEGKWQSHEYEGYRPVAVDWTAFWRFKLKGWTGKMFHSLAGRALCGVGFGVICQVGQVDGQRIPLLRQIIRTNKKDRSEATLKADTLRWVKHHLDEGEVAIADAGVEISDMQAVGMGQYVIRMALNCTGRRNYLPEYKGRGCRPKWGEKVRPLPRAHLEKEIEATPPDREEVIQFQGREIVAQGWVDLIPSTYKPGQAPETFTIWVFFDPLYDKPLVLGTNLQQADPLTIFCLYQDRWPVEQIPLVAKQMLGLHRQFVFAPESCARLPELALLMANILTYLVTVLPPMPTGFWDRHPKKHLAVCVGSYRASFFLKMPCLTPNFAKRRRLRPICPRAWRLIGGKKHRLNRSHQFDTVLQSIF
ncbi:MAG: hypothetical protein M9928_02075 [Anaerolineae bacterium]|nr:hypothetical protein [Anaerolineae bacterium]MCO5188250.1 hypothetical protein [Anaerolineae bacterium]MCO5197045.1 hypothetical protein [Anaerolineae bacterium]MCO5197584.1 hypothetical protein [Anaerolineae bacterium]MCO5197677.1 hypothetical protein [Anaerolineae bacterium]